MAGMQCAFAEPANGTLETLPATVVDSSSIQCIVPAWQPPAPAWQVWHIVLLLELWSHWSTPVSGPFQRHPVHDPEAPHRRHDSLPTVWLILTFYDIKV